MSNKQQIKQIKLVELFKNLLQAILCLQKPAHVFVYF